MSLDDFVEVELDGLRLVRVRIRNMWRDHGAVEDLAQALSSAIREALPSSEVTLNTDPARVRPGMTAYQLRTYMEMQRTWRRSLNEAKAMVGATHGATEIVDDQQRLSIVFLGARFDAIHFNREWAEKASLQSLSDAILDLTADQDLVRDTAYAGKLRELRDLDDQLREFAS